MSQNISDLTRRIKPGRCMLNEPVRFDSADHFIWTDLLSDAATANESMLERSNASLHDLGLEGLDVLGLELTVERIEQYDGLSIEAMVLG